MSAGGSVRIALVSTPRSGNTWIRHLLGDAYAIPTLARHALEPDQWASLPPECVLQMHWLREPGLVERLRAEGFRVVTIARHPFDVLISILHVAVHDVQSEQWLLGLAGDESILWGAWPRHPVFLEYAASPRAAALLAVSREWAADPEAVVVRYEAFVADPAGALADAVARIGPARAADLADVAARHTMAEQRRRHVNNHFWMGRPGLWRELLPAPEAAQLAAACQASLTAFGYQADPDPALMPADADRRWRSLVGPELGQSLRRNTEAFVHLLTEIRGEADAVRLQAEQRAAEAERIAQAARADAEAARRGQQSLAEELAEARRTIAALEATLAPYRELDGRPIRLARRYRDFAARHPRLARPLDAWLARDLDAA
ncbi:MAG: hypothetical protein KatS3mg108_0093 [Isosphaeraceae bacterium]|jgi:hypothetical protein|nr:MAG: hypothetical protein KatS3mg108_0093 [Isosphaeraceae bacterium]